MSIKGIIFDLDGVLVDTVPAHFTAWQRMFNEYGYEFDMREYRRKVDGKPRFDGARAVMSKHSDVDIKEAADKKNEYYAELIERGEFRVFDTALTLVRQCQEMGLKLATASSSANVRTVLEKAISFKRFRSWWVETMSKTENPAQISSWPHLTVLGCRLMSAS